MKLGDLLVDEWVAIPLTARDLESALGELLGLVHRHGAVERERAHEMASGLASGTEGSFQRVNEEIVLFSAALETVAGPSVTVGVARTPFKTTSREREEAAAARAVVLVLAPARDTALRGEIVVAIARALRHRTSTERLLSAESVAEIRGMRELMETEFESRRHVSTALQPIRYRVYPDTPVSEVMDLMVRRHVRAVPVVGDRYEVLGIITVGDALAFLLHRGRPAADSGTPAVAREVMTRAVLCVAEDQTLAEAAHMMVNRDVEQLPVVREGELVGFVTRESILHALFGAHHVEEEKDEDSHP